MAALMIIKAAILGRGEFCKVVGEGFAGFFAPTILG